MFPAESTFCSEFSLGRLMHPDLCNRWVQCPVRTTLAMGRPHHCTQRKTEHSVPVSVAYPEHQLIDEAIQARAYLCGRIFLGIFSPDLSHIDETRAFRRPPTSCEFHSHTYATHYIHKVIQTTHGLYEFVYGGSSSWLLCLLF